jgi:molybdopterin-guanine dinucleotide biosynthesis protein
MRIKFFADRSQECEDLHAVLVEATKNHDLIVVEYFKDEPPTAPWETYNLNSSDVPTMIILDNDLNVLETIKGFPTKEEILSKL